MSSSVDVLTASQLSEVLRVTQEDVAALEDSGYRLVGGVSYTARGLSTKAVLMSGSERDRAAAVVGTLLGPLIAIGSESAENRRLVSRNGSFWQLPAWELCNDLPGADPRRLDDAHSDALGRLKHIFEPRTWTEDVTIEEMADRLAEYLKLIGAFRGIYGPTSGFGRLNDDSRSVKRIKRWNSAEPPHLD